LHLQATHSLPSPPCTGDTACSHAPIRSESEESSPTFTSRSFQDMIRELPELRVTVDRVLFAPHLEAPPERPYPFVYFITIHNDSDQTVTLRGRKWVVTDSQNQNVVVEGEGIVGKFPTLHPGETFSYNSYHVTASDSLAQGAFLALTEDNVAVFAKIPPFALVLPASGT